MNIINDTQSFITQLTELDGMKHDSKWEAACLQFAYKYFYGCNKDQIERQIDYAIHEFASGNISIAYSLSRLDTINKIKSCVN